MSPRRLAPAEIARLHERWLAGWRADPERLVARPAVPARGDVFVNFESGEVEIWDGEVWLPIADVTTVAKIAQQTVEEANKWPDEIKTRLEALGWEAGSPLPPGPTESEGRRLRKPRNRGL